MYEVFFRSTSWDARIINAHVQRVNEKKKNNNNNVTVKTCVRSYILKRTYETFECALVINDIMCF